MYFGSSVSALIIFVQRATCKGCSFCNVCLSAAKSHNAGGANPVSDSLIPVNSLTLLMIVWISSSHDLIVLVYCPWPYKNYKSLNSLSFLIYLRRFLTKRCPLHPMLEIWNKEMNKLQDYIQSNSHFISFSGSSLTSLTFLISSPKWSGIFTIFRLYFSEIWTITSRFFIVVDTWHSWQSQKNVDTTGHRTLVDTTEHRTLVDTTGHRTLVDTIDHRTFKKFCWQWQSKKIKSGSTD